MKSIIMVLLLSLGSIALAQDPIGRILYEEPDESKPVFPKGFNPDGKIGNFSLMLSAGLIKESTEYELLGQSFSSTGFQFASQLALPIDYRSTLFMGVGYASQSQQSIKSTVWSFGAGIKLFGGMSQK